MYQYPNKTEVKHNKNFMEIAKNMGFTENDMIKQYKYWLYPWAIYASEPKKGMRILDAGPGGKFHILKYCSDVGCEVHAVDMKNHPKKLNRVKNLKYHRVDLLRTGMDDNFFDKIYCISVIEHMPHIHRDRFFEEMSRLLKPKGRLYLSSLFDQLVKNGGENEAIKNGQFFPIPPKYMEIKKKGLRMVKAGEYTEQPDYKNDNICWVDMKGKRWIEFFVIYEKE